VVAARAALAIARVDAKLPRAQVGGLNYDNYQNVLQTAERDLEVKQATLANARAAVGRRREDGALEQKKLAASLAFAQAQLASAQVRADRDGVLVHDFSKWNGERFEEGASASPGNVAGQVLGSDRVGVVAWVLEADRPAIAPGQAVQLRFDALPAAAPLTARVDKISATPEARAQWGSGRYFRADIALPAGHGLPLAPGMSVLVTPQQAPAAAVAAALKAPTGGLTLPGELASRVALPIAPPAIPYVWQYNLVQLAPEGALVAPGQPIATFDAGNLGSRLANERSSLNEKVRALEKLTLDQAEAARAADLAVAEARNNQVRAERKASMPPELIRRVDYDKLVIERELAAGQNALAQRLHQARAGLRRAERAALESACAQLRATIDMLAKAQEALTVKAPRSGMVLYRNNFMGQKIAVGNQIWVGMSVATLADPGQLYVLARVPEAQAAMVKVGQRARITVAGGNQALNARVTSLGHLYHSKSRTEPSIVRDVELELEQPPAGLRPGAAVQATLQLESDMRSDVRSAALGAGR
jgi:multidrug resistance efflux pump